jgi:hypothetical protein
LSVGLRAPATVRRDRLADDVNHPEEGPDVAGSEPVTSPDQLKPGSRKGARVGAVVSALILLSMIIGNHEGNTENVWLIILAAGLVLVVLGDAVLRRNGLR